MEAWYFIFDIFIGFINLFFFFQFLPGVTFGTFVLAIIILCLLLRIIFKKR